ncbi:alpha,alpha-trehalose-phosphate synthase (UDP-forming) [Frigidibacter sp. ROC022]|uniref:alpha,alpha-trehalose-phosphate synthase (UDP-forming) n=1 Tax=Frigidibacter sp. ROC022 TaxID=2971796 RepID=UPI00215B2773|nr:trehalose-6-phosphate synthase [Frigidibacter sp. ROC022]MCR8724307.1 trehalose-6-phosphate synthase [Frigidibacter sp. ROC022]
MPRVIAISNRTAADPSARAGGLAVALWDALRASGGLWVGWTGNLVDEPPRSAQWSQDEGVEFLLTDLTRAEYDAYYIGYANRTIWPVFHYRIDLAHFDSAYFDAYAAVNQRIANMVASKAQPDDLVWVHDYHFLLMADCLRRAGVGGPIGFFLHIPFPAPEIFQALPQHDWIARALSAYDVIGLQSEHDRVNLTRYLTEVCGGVETADGRIEVFGNLIRVKAYPIGIDPAAFEEAANSPEATEAATRLGRFLGGRDLVLGVDRMDYTKGLPERFAAVGQFFDAHPEFAGKVSVTQIAPPSRSKVEEYQDLRQQLDELAGRINADYSDLDWIPLRYLARPYSRDELAGLYRIARVGLVTPLRDGMNLVAKEFVTAQRPEDPGVLILSEFAGAAEQLPSALLVNPHDTQQMAEAIHQALIMPLDERQKRWKAAREVIEATDLTWWREAFLDDLRAVAKTPAKAALRAVAAKAG